MKRANPKSDLFNENEPWILLFICSSGNNLMNVVFLFVVLKFALSSSRVVVGSRFTVAYCVIFLVIAF